MIRSLNIDILCLQETLYGPHCGIVSLKRHLHLIPHLTISHADGRFLCASAYSRPNPSSPLLQILNIYTPAQSSPRRVFYKQLSNNIPLVTFLRVQEVPTFLLGDPNFNPIQKSSIADVWLELLDLRFRDYFGQTSQPTFTSTSGSRTRIDFISCSSDHHLSITTTSQEFSSSAQTDHELLAATFRPILESNGPQLWKANPFLAKLPSLSYVEAKSYTKSYQFETNLWRKKTLKKYQYKRNRILHEYKNTAILSSLLPTLEAMIGSLQDEIAHVNALKAGKFWREKGERSAGLLKNLASSRTMQRTISSLFDTSKEQLVTITEDKTSAMADFYDQLYCPEPIDQASLDRLLQPLQRYQLTTAQSTKMLLPITWDDISYAGCRSPRRSSPGADGLSYEVLGILLRIPALRSLVVQVYNVALTLSLFPQSWLLINTDIKMFTRLPNLRLMINASHLINPFQLGFLPGRFIADHGLLT
ncbi:hypothetical protein BD560DRAFT_447020 [Blakeslea trispora]|nr:hypothetical protein BD560DRAFT_447020 [Blakeslea trispora]